MLDVAPPGIAAAALLVAAAVALTSRRRVSRGRPLRLALRAACAAALGLALGAPAIETPGRAVRAVLIDASVSFRPRRAVAEDFAGRMGAPGAEVARFRFAESALPADGPPPSPDGTDIAAALRAALAAGASDVVLLSDGRATAGGALEAAADLARRGVPVHAILPGAPAWPSLAIESVRAPERSRAGTAIPVEVAVVAQGTPALEARVTAGGVAASLAFPTGGGRGVVTLTLPPPPKPGLVEIDVALEPRVDGDFIPEDERARPGVLILPEGRVLAVGDVPAAILPPPFVSPDRVEPGAFPRDPAALAAYDLVVLFDVPADALGLAAQEAIAAYVESGGGLAVLGARRAFGAGGYAGTPLERVLPVRCDPGGRPGRLAVAIALDRSGSMNEDFAGGATGLTKFKAAVTKLAGPLARLSPDDVVAVVLFDRTAQVFRPAAPLDDPGALVAALARERCSGETDIVEGLKLALETVRGVEADWKRVLVVSDGRTVGDPRPFVSALPPGERATIATIAVGKDADRGLLRAIAGIAVEDEDALARALERESDPRRLEPVVEGPIDVRPGFGDHDMSPPLSHAARVTAKDRARVSFYAEVGPILAEAPAGAGHALAYMSADLGRHVVVLPRFLYHAARPAGASAHRLLLRAEGSRLAIEAEAPTATAAPLAVRLSSGPLVPLEEVAPRRFVASVDLPRGPVVAALVRDARALATAIHAPARPLEHAPGPPDDGLLRAIAELTGGRYLAVPAGEAAALPPPRVTPGGGARSLVPALALAALVLFLLDLAAEALLTRPAARLK